MKYVWVFSLLFFTQLSWSADEDTQKINDYIDMAAESVCKEHEDPDCQSEYKNQISGIVMREAAKSFGMRHNFSVDSGSGGATTSSLADEDTQKINDYIDMAAESVCKEHEDPDKCRSEYKNQISGIVMREAAKSFGMRHNFSVDSGSGGATTSSLADEDTQKINDYIDMAAESVCKEHEDPDKCRSEYKNQIIRIVMREAARSFGMRHNFSVDSGSGGATTSSLMDYSPE